MNYNQELDKKNHERLIELCEQLPSFFDGFFNSISLRTTSLTQINYAYDFILLFRFLRENHRDFKNFTDVKDIPVKLMDNITVENLEAFQAWLSRDHATVQYGKEYADGAERLTIKRKLSSLRTLYKYLTARNLINNNPTLLIDMPKIKEHEIIRMDPAEVANLLDNVEFGLNLTKHEAVFHEKSGVRDLAIVTLLLGTGIRVSECVGIDTDSFNWDETSVLVHRKGGKEERIYFGTEVEQALLAYKAIRDNMNPEPGHEKAFFISRNNVRITPRSVERLVKKYSQTITTKHITPHKCRSTYGTNLYRETGDVLLVSKQLGHSSPTVTAQHYTATDEDQKISVRNTVKLREDT
ncbi:MAG: tyrosine-type recombinase/integrase [Lachnospiraceae bacterium]|nr:tyrosine-type recombinase/integrase [Lachnospiraceae bacterium]